MRYRVLADDLTAIEADGVEQVLMEGYGGASWNGGTLINRINVIDPSRQYYSTATEAAYRIIFE